MEGGEKEIGMEGERQKERKKKRKIPPNNEKSIQMVTSLHYKFA